MPNDPVVCPNEGGDLSAIEEGITVNDTAEGSEEIAEPARQNTPTCTGLQPYAESLESVKQHAVQDGQYTGESMTSPLCTHRGWQSMPFEGEIEEAFAWELGEGSEGMPALESPESLILVEGEEPEDMLDDSPSRLEWLRQKRDDAAQNEHLDRVMAMIGHERVKEHFLAVKERASISGKWNEDPRDLKLNLVLYEGQDIGWFTNITFPYCVVEG